MSFLTRFESAGKSNLEQNNGLDKVVRIGYTSLAERVKVIIRQADENYALRMSDFDDMQNVDFDVDEMLDVVTSNEFDNFQYLEMVKDIQTAQLERQQILEQREEEQRKAYEAWLTQQSGLANPEEKSNNQETSKSEETTTETD